MEFRSTASGFLGGVDGLHDEPRGDVQRGILNLVTDQGDNRLRRLPSLYISTTPVFSHRDLNVVRQAAQHFLQVISSAPVESIYRLNAIRHERRLGLYGRDFYNRSSFRLRLERLGFEFAIDPYVRLGQDGRFECQDWGRFEASFVVLDGDPASGAGVERPTPGELAFVLGTRYRLGDLLSKDDLSTLAELSGRIEGLVVAQPDDLREALSRIPGGDEAS